MKHPITPDDIIITGDLPTYTAPATDEVERTIDATFAEFIITTYSTGGHPLSIIVQSPTEPVVYGTISREIDVAERYTVAQGLYVAYKNGETVGLVEGLNRGYLTADNVAREVAYETDLTRHQAAASKRFYVKMAAAAGMLFVVFQLLIIQPTRATVVAHGLADKALAKGGL